MAAYGVAGECGGSPASAHREGCGQGRGGARHPQWTGRCFLLLQIIVSNASSTLWEHGLTARSELLRLLCLTAGTAACLPEHCKPCASAGYSYRLALLSHHARY